MGLVVAVLLLSYLIFLCFRWAARVQRYLPTRRLHRGWLSAFLVQSSLNIRWVSGLVPLTGYLTLCLPMGGTSMVLTMMVGSYKVMIIEEKRVLEAQVSQVRRTIMKFKMVKRKNDVRSKLYSKTTVMSTILVIVYVMWYSSMPTK